MTETNQADTHIPVQMVDVSTLFSEVHTQSGFAKCALGLTLVDTAKQFSQWFYCLLI